MIAMNFQRKINAKKNKKEIDSQKKSPYDAYKRNSIICSNDDHPLASKINARNNNAEKFILNVKKIFRNFSDGEIAKLMEVYHAMKATEEEEDQSILISSDPIEEGPVRNSHKAVMTTSSQQLNKANIKAKKNAFKASIQSTIDKEEGPI